MSALHVFDLDATMLPGTTASVEIARELHCHALVARWEKQLDRGELAPLLFAAKTYELWAAANPPLTPDAVRDVFDRAPWRPEFLQVLSHVSSLGEHSMVITTAPDFFAQHLTTWGVTEIVGQPMGPLPLTAPRYDPGRYLSPLHKRACVERTYRQLAQADPHLQLIAYGDSSSALPLLLNPPEMTSPAGSVAVNSSSVLLRELASVTYDGPDMWTAYRRGRRLLRDWPTTSGAAS